MFHRLRSGLVVALVPACLSLSLACQVGGEAESQTPAGRQAKPTGPRKLVSVTELAGVAGDSRAAVFADFDGDGQAELFVGRFKSADLLLELGPDGAWSGAPAGTAGEGEGLTFALAAGDLNGDGRADLFVGCANGQANALYLGRKPGQGFGRAPAGSVEVGAFDTYAATLTDLDGDGDLDLAVANEDGPNELHLNDGRANLTALVDPAVCGETTPSRDLAAGDLDGDGDTDLVVANSGGVSDLVFLNDGLGAGGVTVSFSASPQGTLPGSTGRSSGCDLADVDGDGDLDLAICARKGDPERLLLNDGAARFSPAAQALSAAANGNGSACAFVDLDGEHGVDLIVTHRKAPASFYRSLGQGRFQLDPALDPSQAPREGTGLAASAPDAQGGLWLLLTDATGQPSMLRWQH